MCDGMNITTFRNTEMLEIFRVEDWDNSFVYFYQTTRRHIPEDILCRHHHCVYVPGVVVGTPGAWQDVQNCWADCRRREAFWSVRLASVSSLQACSTQQLTTLTHTCNRQGRWNRTAKCLDHESCHLLGTHGGSYLTLVSREIFRNIIWLCFHWSF